MSLIKILKILSDENRLRMFNIIKEDALCVGEIRTLLGLSQSNVSRHLEKMKNTGMVTYRKEAQWVIYQLSDPLLSNHTFIKHLLFEDLSETSPFKEDLVRLKKYKESGLTCQELRKVDFDYEKIEFKK